MSSFTVFSFVVPHIVINIIIIIIIIITFIKIRIHEVDGGAWTGFNWLRIGTDGGLL